VVIVGLLIAVYPTYVVVELLASAFARYPVLASASALVWGLYAIPFIWVLRRIDYFEREPRITLAAAFAWGAIVSIGLSLEGNTGIADIVAVNQGGAFNNIWGAAIGGPTEELTKGIGILLILLASPRRPRSALDGLVVGAMVGVGFQIVEDFTYTINVAVASDTTSLAPLLQMFIVRGLVAGVASHAVYSGIVGLGIGYMLTASNRSKSRRFGGALLGFAVAYALHFFWNAPALFDGDLGVLLDLMLKIAVVLAVLLLALRYARKRDRALYLPQLKALSPHLCTPAEADALATRRTRRRWARAFTDELGRPNRKRARALERARADLAVGMLACDPNATASALGEVERLRVLGAPAGWFTDPYEGAPLGALRYWDGRQWTGYSNFG